MNDSNVLEREQIKHITGEPFYVVRDEGMVFLVHERWSLMAMGSTIQEAEEDLILTAQLLSQFYSSSDPGAMTPDALTLRAFISKLTLQKISL